MLRSAPTVAGCGPSTEPAPLLSPARLTLSGLAPLRYLAGLRVAQKVLWCYLIWYLVVLARYFDPSPALWLSSLGIGAIVGTALYLSTALAGRTRVTLGRWQLARLFVMPFCVSSFAALIKGHGFVLVFHPSGRDNLIAAAACTAFVAASAGLRWLVPLAASSQASADQGAASPPSLRSHRRASRASG